MKAIRNRLVPEPHSCTTRQVNSGWRSALRAIPLHVPKVLRAIRASGVLRGWIDKEEWQWLHERVGTIHTAQGREAEAVIIVLGAPNPSQTGARIWAGKRPNIHNVAITRAKEVVYVVGNRKLWREAGVFADLDKYLTYASDHN